VDDITSADLQFYFEELDTGKLKPSSNSNQHAPSSAPPIGLSSQNPRESPAPVVPSQEEKLKCAICSCDKDVVKSHRYNINVCPPCKTFLWKSFNKDCHYICLTGRNNCDLSPELKYTRCAACRLKKARDLGADRGLLPTSELAKHLQSQTSHATTFQSQTNHATTSQSADDSIRNREKTARSCSICGFNNYVANSYGIECCQNCRKFIRTTVEQNRFYKCENDNTCLIDRQNGLQFCKSCRWNKAEQQPKFQLKRMSRPPEGESGQHAFANPHVQETPSDDPQASTDRVEDINAPQQDYLAEDQRHQPSHLTQAVNRPSPVTTDKFSCSICSDGTRVCNYRGLRVCCACRTFLNYITQPTRKKFTFCCVTGRYDCDISWTMKATGQIRCRGCRVKKARECGFSDPRLTDTCLRPEIASPSRCFKGFKQVDTQRCSICSLKYVGRLIKRYYNIVVCQACKSFLYKVANERKETLYCQTGLYNCDVTRKIGFVKTFVCQACRVKKAFDVGLKHPVLTTKILGPLLKAPNGNTPNTVLVTSSAPSETIQTTINPTNEEFPSFSHAPADLADNQIDCNTFEPLPSTSTTCDDQRSRLPTPQSNQESRCCVCSRVRSDSLTVYFNIKVCAGCRNFIWRISKSIEPIVCDTGHYDCSPDRLSGKNVCPGCRLKKAIVCGLKHPALTNNLPPEIIQSATPTMNHETVQSRAGQTPTSQLADSPIELQGKITCACCICGNGNHVSKSYGITCCKSCKKFIRKTVKKNKNYECKNGGGCVVGRRRGMRCKSCRWDKILNRADFELKDRFKHQENETTVEQEAPVPATQVRIITAEELDGDTDELGLPLNINERFSRWLYSDFECFQAGRMSSKTREDEVKPDEIVKVISLSNKLDDDFTYLSRDLDEEDELQPIQELSTSILKIRPSVKLLKAQVASDNQTQDCNTPTKSKPFLTLILETRKTIIDRRPMFGRSVENEMKRQRENSSTVQESESLIGPGEDCDDSDDNVIMEIDCDNL
jgi:hypothetical protein